MLRMGWAGWGSLPPLQSELGVQRGRAAGVPGSGPGPAISSWWRPLPLWGHRDTTQHRPGRLTTAALLRPGYLAQSIQ